MFRALQRNPEERWQSAREMGTALRHVLAQQETLVGPAELAEWMATLFPEGESRKRGIMEIARTGATPEGADPPHRPEHQSAKRGIVIPQTSGGAKPPPTPPLPPSILAMAIGVAAVLTVVVASWLR